MKPSIFIAMPCYDSVKISTMLSIFQLIQHCGKANIEVGINTMKSPLIHQARNYLTSVFLTTEYTHLLFIDSDVEFGPEVGLHMVVADKDVICTPYRVKNENVAQSLYTVSFPDSKVVPLLPGKLVEIEAGPAGLMLIKRGVFEKIIKNRPDLKIKNPVGMPQRCGTNTIVIAFIITFLISLLKTATQWEKMSPFASWFVRPALKFMQALNG